MALLSIQTTLYRGAQILAQGGLGSLFGYAAYIKLRDPFSFGQQIVAYALPIPYQVIDVLVWIVPGTELVLAFLLISGIYTRVAASLSGFLLAGFTLLVLSAMWRGLAIDCGCFGIPQPVGWAKLLENLCLLILAIVLTKWPGYTHFETGVFRKKGSHV